MRMITGVGAVVVLLAATVAAQAQAQQPRSQTAARPATQEVFVSIGDVNRQGPDGATPLHVAVRAGDSARVQALLRAGANVNATTRYANLTPLALAATNGDASLTEALLKAGANANAANSEGETVLMTAARTGNPAVVKALLDHGARVNAREEWYGQTALTWAAAQNNAAVVKLLADAGADLNARATWSPGAARGGNTTTSTPGGMTPLLYAARNGALESIRTLVDSGSSVNLTDPNGITPLVYAIINGHFDAAAVLLEKGANPNIVDITGRGPLFVAVDMHTLEFRFNRPDPKLTDRLTSLDLVTMLLDKGANVNQALTSTIIPPKGFANGNRNLTEGSTPFLKAATTSDLELMKLLYEHGANPRVTNRTGANALHVAAGIGWRVIYSKGTQDEAIEAITWLLSLNVGFNINETNSLGETALHGAAMRTPDQDANTLIEFLVASGANLYAKNSKGRTAADESEGEEITPENGGGDRRGINTRTRALLQDLMAKNPERAVASQQ